MEDKRTRNLTGQPELQLQLSQFAMDNASIEIYWLDSDAGICYANNHACKTLGYSKEEFIQLSLADLDPNYPIDQWKGHWQSLKHDKTQSFETLHKRKDGVTFPVEVVASYVCFDGHEYNVGFARDITERKQAEASLVASEERYRGLSNDMPLFIATFLPDGTLTYVNDLLCASVAMTPATLTGMIFFDFLSVDDREMVRTRLALLTPDKPIETHEQRYQRPGERDIYHRWTNRAFFDAAGRAIRFQAVGEDITEYKQVRDALYEKEEFFRTISENVEDFIAVLDLNGRRLYNNPSYANFFGGVETLKGTDSFAEIHPDDRERIKQVFKKTVQSGIGHRTEFRFVLPNGSIRNMESSGWLIKNSQGEALRVIVVSHDITERKQAEDKILDLAFHDPLTRLPNRRLLSDRLEKTMAVSKRSGLYSVLMFLDLDNFKPINDAHGHAAGDLLLVEAARRISSCVREVDTIARYGGDEFMVMLGELDADKAESVTQAGIVAEKIRTVLSEPYFISVHHEGNAEVTIEHHCTSSIGIALFVNHEGSAEDIIKWADMAMYQAKEAGRNQIRFYEANT